jgi:flavin-binding protein dodecin
VGHVRKPSGLSTGQSGLVPKPKRRPQIVGRTAALAALHRPLPRVLTDTLGFPPIAWASARAHNSREGGHGLHIIREMVGTSPGSWSDAARQAVATAAQTVCNIRSVEVVKSTATVENGAITESRVELKIIFEYEPT